jgi:hypothetical protein
VRVVGVTRRRDSHEVNPLTTFVRSMGNAGAVANVQAVLDARVLEDWLVQGLAHRLERSDLSAAPAAAVVTDVVVSAVA